MDDACGVRGAETTKMMISVVSFGYKFGVPVDADLVVGAVPGFMGFATLKRVIEAGKDVVDISFFPEDAFLLDEPLSALDAPLRRLLREELMQIVSEWGVPTVLVTHDLTEAFQLADRIVIYDEGRVVQAAPKSELLSRPASAQVARLLGVRNILDGTVLKATPEIIQLRWRGYTLEAINSPSRGWLPPPGTPVVFFIRPEYVRLIRKDRPGPDPTHYMNRMEGRVVGQVDQGATWALSFAVDGAAPHARETYDLEIEVPRLVHEMLEIGREHRWAISMHRGSIHVLPHA